MTRFAHSVWFFFSVAIALLCSAVTMLFLNQTWDNPGFTSLVTAAIVVSLILPAASAFIGQRLLKWQQPFMTWLVFCITAAIISLILLSQILA
ncbi:MAG: hypothetical protein OER80_12340 [Gammaproteobacteria bacterium]|nr:hypothetical protein [Gammaproteobacteria bacterium]MDH3767953.1 hypothetical protein [Gammaproteobacteria bacterium]